MTQDKKLNIRMSERRLDKLSQYAVEQDKTITQVVSDWIDRLHLKHQKL